MKGDQHGTSQAKEVTRKQLTEVDEETGTFQVTSKNGTYKLCITQGYCTCTYFRQSHVPCKHMFAVFALYQWTWGHLPKSLTASPYLTLDEPVLPLEVDTACDWEPLSLEQEDNCEDGAQERMADDPPLKVTPGQRLRSLQGQIRDSLAQCISAAYMVDDHAILADVKCKIESIHSTLISSAASNPNNPNELPILSRIVQAGLHEYREKAKLLHRANLTTRKYRRMRKRKHTSSVSSEPKRCKVSNDSLQGATRNSVGRPKKKRKRKGNIARVRII